MNSFSVSSSEDAFNCYTICGNSFKGNISELFWFSSKCTKPGFVVCELEILDTRQQGMLLLLPA